MVDDTAQQVQNSVQAPGAPSTLSVPESPSDQSATTPPADVGQIPPNWPSEKESTPSSSISRQTNDWPISPNLANNDSTASSSAQTEQPEIVKEERPESLEMAGGTQSQEATSSAQPTKSVKETQLEQPVSSDEPIVTTPSGIPAAATPTETESPVLETTAPQSQSLESSQSPISPQSSLSPLPDEALAKEGPPDLSDVGTLSNLPPTTPQADTNAQPQTNQTSQVQSEPSESASKNDAEPTASQSASFRPEPLEQPQEAPLAVPDIQPPAQKSFGDLLKGEIQSPSNPSSPSIPSTPLDSSNSPLNSPTPQPASPSGGSPLPADLSAETSVKVEASEESGQSPVSPSISFGDLIKDIEITPPVVPEAQRPTETQQSPTPSQPASTAQQPQTPLSPPEQKIIEKPVEVIKEMKVVDHDEVQKQIKESLQSEQQQRRAAANKARFQRKEENLTRVLFLLRNKPAITNDEVRDYLHVSQSTATNYLAELVRRGSIKREGITGATKYHL